MKANMDYETLRNSMTIQDATRVLRDTNCYGTMDIAKNVILKVLDEHMSHSEKPNKWIPATTLPEKDGEYLLFGKIDEDEDDYIFIGEYDSCGEKFGIWQEQFDRSTLGCLGSEFYEYASVLAWMPLPTSYQGESEDII